MASAVDSRLAYARLSAVATASRLPTATRGSNNSYTTSWDTTTPTSWFHYFETIRQSLALQWVDKASAPHFLGQMIAVGSIASLAAFALIYLALDVGGLDMRWGLRLGWRATVGIIVAAWVVFPASAPRSSSASTWCCAGAIALLLAGVHVRTTCWCHVRRAAPDLRRLRRFLMVERFGCDAAEITLMFLVNSAINIVAAPRIGKLIARWGERRALSLEYLLLIAVFVGYAFVQSAWFAVGLYIVDHMVFAMAIAIKTYFQKIADPADIASTAGVSFTINHIAAVIIPVVFGLLWLILPAAVFLAGAAMAAVSLVLSRLVPPAPGPNAVSVALVGPRPAYSG